jgi:hypothetical protein
MFLTQNKQRTIPDDNLVLLRMGGWVRVNELIDRSFDQLRNSHFVSIYGIKRRATGATSSVNLKILTHTDT